MRRGEIWSAAGGPDYVGKPRPVLILQEDSFAELDSITLCPITTVDTSFRWRVFVKPSELNGLRQMSHLMIDKLSTIHRFKLGKKIGSLEAEYMAELEQAIVIFLGLAGKDE